MQLTRPLHKAVIECPDRTAWVDGAHRCSYAKLLTRVQSLAAVLRARGVEKGDRVGLLGMNSGRYIESLFAIWWVGAVANPVNIRWTAAEIAYSLDDCGTGHLIVDATFAAKASVLLALSTCLHDLVFFGDGAAPEGMADAEALMADIAPIEDVRRHGDDLAAVMYTGGTTGRPKGVMLSHANLCVGTLAASTAVHRDQRVVAVSCAPLFHVGAVGHLLQLMGQLATLVLLPAFDETAVLQAIAAEQATETFLVPTMLKRVVEHPRLAEYDLSSLRWVLYGAAPIDDALLTLALTRLPATGFVQFYGMTELSPVITALPACCHEEGQPRERLRSAGRPVPTAEVRVVNGEGQWLPPGQVGEIVARGFMVMQGYWGQEALSAETLRGGWMHTGDLGRFDADGFLYVVDRLKDMVITGGENVYSAEVENVLLQAQGVAACAVVGVPDATWGERVHAVVVLKPEVQADASALIEHCRAHLAGYKCPRSIEFRDSLPLSAAGKLLKYEVRASVRA